MEPPAANLVQVPQTTASNLVKPIPIKVNAGVAAKQEAGLQQKQQVTQSVKQTTSVGGGGVSGGVSVDVTPPTPKVGGGGGLLITASTPDDTQAKVHNFISELKCVLDMSLIQLNIYSVQRIFVQFSKSNMSQCPT